MQLSVKKKKLVAINISSLIDVMFILLIFFMVSSTFLEQPGIKLELPSTGAHDITEVKEVTLYVNSLEELFLNDKPITLNALKPQLEKMLPLIKDQTLTLKADKDVSHGLVVKVMDISKQSGVKKLVIATKVDE